MRKNSDIENTAAVFFYIAAAFVFVFYAAADFMPGFLLSTAGRLVLLCLCCVFMWLGGFLFYKSGKGNSAMRINLLIYLVLFLLLFATLTLFDPLWGRSSADFVRTKELFAAYAENSLNLVPFRTIAEYFGKGDMRQFMVNICGNFVCLMPLGILLPLNFKKQKHPGIFLLTCSLIVAAVELLQFATLAGSCDIDDLILNVGGAFLVYIAAKTKNIEKFLRFVFLMEK